MVYVIIEINGFIPLEKIDKSFTVKIINNLNKILESNTCTARKQYGSFFLYNYSPGLEDLKRLFGEILEAYDYLISIRKELRGFNILIDQLKGIPSKLQRTTVIKKIYRVMDDESLYVTEDALDLFSRIADFTKTGDFYKVSSTGKINIKEEGGIIEFLAETEGMGKLLDVFEPLLNGKRKGLFFYYDSEIPGISSLSYSMSKIIEGDSKETPWIYLLPEKNDFSFVLPLLRCFQNEFLDGLHDYLTLLENKVWNQLYGLISDKMTLTYEEDAVLIFKLYLTAYSRYLKEKNLPVVVYILEVDKFQERTIEIIAQIIEEFMDELDIIPVLFSGQPDIPACFHNFQVVKCRSEGWPLSEENNDEKQSPVTYYHSYLLKGQKGITLAGLEASRYLISEFDSYTKRILYIVTLFNGVLNTSEIIGLLTEEQSEKIKYNRAFNDLTAYGFLFPGRILPVLPELLDEIRKIHGTEEDQFFRNISLLYRNYRGIDPHILKSLSDIFQGIGDKLQTLDFHMQTINSLIEQRRTEAALLLFEKASVMIKKLKPENPDVSLTYNLLFLKAALFDSRDQLAGDLVQDILAAGESNDDFIEINRNVVLAEYFYSRYTYHKALEPAKKALMYIQKSEKQELESLVNTLLGKIMLGMQRIEEAKDYFRIAREQMSDSYSKALNVESYYFESITYFVFGNLSESLRLITKTILIADEYGKRNWQLLALFVKGRIYFDLGKYRTAADIFSECLTLADIYHIQECDNSLYPWIARSFIYSGSRKEGERILKDHLSSAEGLLFFSENLYFEGKYDEALQVIDRSFIIENDRIRVFLSPNFTLKGSGFEYVEDLVFIVDDGHGVLFHLLKAYRAFFSSLNYQSREGAAELEKLTRDEKLSDIDPYNGLYYFFHALSLPEKAGTDGLDRLTLLSKALRHVQTIASRIDNPTERREFLNKNYWNSKLLEAGRKNKLL